jgi:hypothetical protein
MFAHGVRVPSGYRGYMGPPGGIGGVGREDLFRSENRPKSDQKWGPGPAPGKY